MRHVAFIDTAGKRLVLTGVATRDAASPDTVFTEKSECSESVGESEILQKLQDPFLLAQPVLLVLTVADALRVFCKTGNKGHAMCIHRANRSSALLRSETRCGKYSAYYPVITPTQQESALTPYGSEHSIVHHLKRAVLLNMSEFRCL